MNKYANSAITADVTVEDNILFVSGNLNFFNVMSLYQKSLLSFKQLILLKPSIIHFDFSKLLSSDSAGLALTIEWIKLAKEHQVDIRFSHYPQNLLTIAKAAHLDQLITCAL